MAVFLTTFASARFTDEGGFLSSKRKVPRANSLFTSPFTTLGTGKFPELFWPFTYCVVAGNFPLTVKQYNDRSIHPVVCQASLASWVYFVALIKKEIKIFSREAIRIDYRRIYQGSYSIHYKNDESSDLKLSNKQI